MKTVSLVIPMFNEEANVDALRQRLNLTLDKLSAYRFEIVLIDDHSTDRTRALALNWSRDDDRVRYIRFSRNFGSHAALTAGLRAATGDCAILMAADLQDPPELIPTLLNRWREGSRVVWGVRSKREGVSLMTRLTSKAFWWLMRVGSKEATPATGADFALLDRKVIDAFKDLPGRNTSVIATICWLGFEQTFVPYVKEARHAGTSGWSLSKKCKLLIDSVVGFSYWPIRAMSGLGIGCAALGFAFMGYVVWQKLVGFTSVPGWTALMSVMLMGIGILMVMVGVLGEYLWRVLDETRGRPEYVIEETAAAAPRPATENWDEFPAVLHRGPFPSRSYAPSHPPADLADWVTEVPEEKDRPTAPLIPVAEAR